MAAGWRPAVDQELLVQRARMLAAVRGFFAERGVLEVDTPLLISAVIPERHIDHLVVAGDEPAYLQASPEWAMKRLVAAGSGPIYQITRAFRGGELGRWHQPEFALLEWYRPGWSCDALMAEVVDLLGAVGLPGTVHWLAYGELFREVLGVDPHVADGPALQAVAEDRGVHVTGIAADDKSTWLDLLFSHIVEPALPGGVVLIYDFPAVQAALARVDPGPPPVARRFEVYVDGLELANGFDELTDPAEQHRRFEADRVARSAAGLPNPPPDEGLLAALARMPDTAGVALGLDRLMARLTDAPRLSGTLPFPW